MNVTLVPIWECECGRDCMVKEDVRKGDVLVCPHCDRREKVESIFGCNRLPREDDELEAENFSTY